MHECIIHIIKLEHPIKAAFKRFFCPQKSNKGITNIRRKIRGKLTLKDVDAYAGYLRVRWIARVFAGVQEIRVVDEQNGLGLLGLDGLEFQPPAGGFLAEHLRGKSGKGAPSGRGCHIKSDFLSLQKLKPKPKERRGKGSLS